MLEVYIDADACPVKDETYRVALRHGFPVWVVANQYIQTPREGDVKLVTVKRGEDSADDWIAERAGPGDIVITADIPLASRALARGARVLGPRGREFDAEGIGDALASRELSSQLREMGVQTGGPPPFTKQDRSAFLNRLDALAHAVKRGR
ncbi:MAG: YaiI/YqxD family protein [Myxococcales bacterium]|nr:YaiI/YqxD family protein [Myxococcales bacterium]MCB9736771.1 YaiI/YqxD family protein [Deltaproteobacteria bacterium]